MQAIVGGEQRILGVDFSSAPGKNKAITVAVANLQPAKSQPERAAALLVQRVTLLRSLDAFAALVAQAGPWLMGIDAPFSQPLPLVAALGWDRTPATAPAAHGPCQHESASTSDNSATQRPCDAWRTAALHAAALQPPAFKAELQRFCDGQPPGHKHLKRRCDALAGAVSPISSVRTPVAQMYHRLVPILEQAGVCVAPFMCSGDGDTTGMLPAHAAMMSDLHEPTAMSEATEAALSSVTAGATASNPNIQQLDHSRIVVEVYPSLVARRLVALHLQGHEQAATSSAGLPQALPTPAATSHSSSTRKRARHEQAPAQPAPASLPRHAPAYKSNSKDSASSAATRQRLVQAAKEHCSSLYGFELQLGDVEEQCVADSKGDVLDAVFAAMQAGWACMQGPGAHYGAPVEVQAEGWIYDPWMAVAYAQSNALQGQSL